MVMITLVGETQARVGNRFYYMGPQLECRECKLRTVCFNLEAGHQYEITSVRDTHHDCDFHEGGVRVVEIMKIPTIATIPKKTAIEGSLITYEGVDCERMSCEHYGECHPIGIKSGDKLKIEKDLGEIDCPYGDDLILSKLM